MSLNCTMNKPRCFTGNEHQLGEQKVELPLVTHKGHSHLVKLLDGKPSKLW